MRTKLFLMSAQKAEQIQVVIASSNNHIKTATELQNHHHPEPPEMQLDRGPGMKDTEKKPCQDG